MAVSAFASNRRSVLVGLAATVGGLVAGADALFLSGSACAQSRVVQTEFTLYRNSQHPLAGTIGGARWQYPGTALTANTTQFYADENLALSYARWVLVWNPNTSASPTGVRLIHADSGPTNEVELARFLRTYTNTPVVDAVDITADLQGLTEHKTLAHQTAGNGQGGCKIYGSWIECIWG